MADMKKYLDTTALGALVTQIKAEDAKVLQSSKDYSNSLAKNYESAGAAATAEQNAKAYTDQLAQGAVKTNTDAIAKLNGGAEVEGSVAKAVADSKALIDTDIDVVEGNVSKNAQDIAAINNAETGILAQAKKHTDDEVAKVQQNLDNLDAFVGDIPEGYTEASVVAYIDKKAEEVLTAATGGSSENAASVKAQLDAYKTSNDAKVNANAAAAKTADDKAVAAQAAADAAKSHSEGVATDLAEAIKTLETADAGQVERIASLEETIVGLSGAMHFEGVKDAVPEDVSGYEQGDVIIVGNKEYVLNGTAFVEFGDASVNAEAITALTSRVDTADGKISTLETKMTAVEGVAAAAAPQTALDTEIERATGAEDALDKRLQDVEAKFTDSGEGSVSEQIADAKSEVLASAATDAKTKADAAEKNAKDYADGINETLTADIDALEATAHSHANKALLDSYTQTEENLADAVAKKHEHANADVLAAISDAKVKAWDGAEAAAKLHADNLNTAMTAKVDGIDGRVKNLESGIATKAEQDDLDAAVERIAKNEADIAANKTAINSFAPITSEEVNALFA